MDMKHGASRPRILIVDDCPINIKTLAAILKGRLEILAAISGQDGLETARNQLPSQIFFDVELPDADRFQLIQTLKNDPKTREIPVIFVTSHAENRDQARGIALGAADFIAKPFQPERIRNCVERMLKKTVEEDQSSSN